MNDTPDPFADRPYVPPTTRDADEPTATEAPTEGHVVGDTPAPAAEPTVTAATIEQPAAPPAPPAAPERVAAEPVAVPTAPAAEEPPAYTHRYTDEPALAAASAQVASTESTTPTTTFPAPSFDGNEPSTPPFATAGDEPPKSRGGRRLVSAVALVALAGAAGFGGAAGYDAINGDNDGATTVSSLDTGKTSSTSVPASAIQKVAEKVLPSVVQINVKGSSDAGSGTGIIISSDGEILTNNHVVEVAGDKGTITVAFSDGTNATATIIGTDPLTDLAVIKAKGKSGLAPATLGSSADLKVGQEVVAIGSPFGLESTVTSGIISALNRPVTSSSASANSQATTFPAVQTDAAINPGNSGGPLVDLNGNVVAINSAIRSGATAGEAGSIGLGFAIPIDLAKNVSKQLLDGKKVEHARIGVKVGAAVSSDDITGIGALVSEVTKGGAGEKAGLKKDDIITAVNGHPVASNEALVASVRGYQPGEKITITYQRGGKTSTVDVTLDSDGGKLSE